MSIGAQRLPDKGGGNMAGPTSAVLASWQSRRTESMNAFRALLEEVKGFVREAAGMGDTIGIVDRYFALRYQVSVSVLLSSRKRY